MRRTNIFIRTDEKMVLKVFELYFTHNSIENISNIQKYSNFENETQNLCYEYVDPLHYQHYVVIFAALSPMINEVICSIDVEISENGLCVNWRNLFSSYSKNSSDDPIDPLHKLHEQHSTF